MSKTKLSLQEQYDDFLRNLLDKRLYDSTSNLTKELITKFSVSSANARKILTRAVKNKAIKSSYPYIFGKGQYIYLNEGSDLDSKVVMTITKKSRPPIYRLLKVIELNEGIISYYEALKITASPLDEGSTKVDSLDDILSLLQGLDLVFTRRDSNDVKYILAKPKTGMEEMQISALMSSQYTKMLLDCSVIPDILRWIQKTNLIDNDNILYRSKKSPSKGVKHNNLVWDAIAYTRATGINITLGAKANTLEKQTLVVLDIVMADSYTSVHFDAFIDRIQINRMSVVRNVRKILPIIIYRSCSDELLNKTKANGILTFNLSTIFGTRIYDVLSKFRKVTEVIKNNANVEDSIESILNSIKDAGQEDALKELRGTLFEYLMYPLLKTVYPNASIERGRRLSELDSEGKTITYEYDYIIESSNPSEIIFVELKGYHSGATIPLGDNNTKASLKWFFRRTLPFAKRSNGERFGGEKQLKGLFITSANFWKDGEKFIEEMNKGKLKSFLLNTGYERTGLIELLGNYGFKKEISILEKFYEEPPKSKIGSNKE